MTLAQVSNELNIANGYSTEARTFSRFIRFPRKMKDTEIFVAFIHANINDGPPFFAKAIYFSPRV
ncbi:hypothetical protein DH21_20315 [Serratia marcescens]|nr:hypothetical protein DH21_20315 [Serratia marcescens]